jgi:Uma2 family endonuclease
MNVVFRTTLPSVEEFLAWEREQELRYEFDGREAVPIVGGTLRHGRITRNLSRAIEDRLRGTACQVFSSDVKVLVMGRVRYPDAVVTCSPLTWTSDVVPEPVAVFEVLSPSTARTDWTLKTKEYQATSSVQHYAMLEQDTIAAHVFTRGAETWEYQLVHKDGALALPAIGVSLTLAECYAGITMG